MSHVEHVDRAESVIIGVCSDEGVVGAKRPHYLGISRGLELPLSLTSQS